jgi:hypothetical protein
MGGGQGVVPPRLDACDVRYRRYTLMSVRGAAICTSMLIIGCGGRVNDRGAGSGSASSGGVATADGSMESSGVAATGAGVVPVPGPASGETSGGSGVTTSTSGASGSAGAGSGATSGGSSGGSASGALPQACVNDIDCTANGTACGSDVCVWPGMRCMPAGYGKIGTEGWCTVDTDCKCSGQGAKCYPPYCSFTNPSSPLPSAASVQAMCPLVPMSKVFHPAEFCVLFNATCSGANTLVQSLATESTCESTYSGWTMSQQACRSYHLCNAARGGSYSTAIHCPHAQGMGGLCL